MSKVVCKENKIMDIYKRWYAQIYEINETKADDINLIKRNI